jgi:hypothetical protein
MWYKASSVITAILDSNNLSVASGSFVPACPKTGNNIHCHSDFPDCEGKYLKCPQSLRMTNERGDPTILYFDYYLSTEDRDGRIKIQNSTLRMLINKYDINETAMIPA